MDDALWRCAIPDFGFSLLVSMILVLSLGVVLCLFAVRRSVLGHRVRNDYKTGSMIAQLTAFIGRMLAIADVIGIVFGEFAGLSLAIPATAGIQLSMFTLTPLFVRIESGLPIVGLPWSWQATLRGLSLMARTASKLFLRRHRSADRPTGRRLHPEN
jgi:hypothetical protein